MSKQKLNMKTIISSVFSLIALVVFVLNRRELSQTHMLIMILLQLISIIVSYTQIRNHENVRLNILNIIIALLPWIIMLIFLIAILIFKPPLAP